MAISSYSIANFVRLALTVALATVLAGGAYAQTVVRTVSLSRPARIGDLTGVWSGNALVEVENYDSGTPVLRISDESGAEVQRVSVQIPGAQMLMTVNNQFARSADGYLAISGWAYGAGDRAAHYLIVISPGGMNQTVVRTDPYAPRALVFASDGAIWTAGLEKNAEGIYKEGRFREPDADYFVIRRFDKGGRLLGAALPQSTLPDDQPPLEGSRLVASKDRVGWFSPFSHRYVEFSLDGKELASYRHSVSLRQDAGMALCDDDRAWLSVKADVPPGKAGDTMLMSLDRERGTWSSTKEQPGFYLLGCTGTTLVTTTTWDRLQWMATR